MFYSSNFLIKYKKYISYNCQKYLPIKKVNQLCLFEMLSSGIYVVTPCGVRILNKINHIIKKHQNKIGYEVIFPYLCDINIFYKSCRNQKFINEIFSTSLKNKQYSLSPTCEEIASIYAYNNVEAYCLPTYMYQIGKKFRKEIRTKNSILRTLEFNMLDGYVFCSNLDSLMFKYYECALNFINIFKELNIKISIINSDSTSMCGFKSHEFVVNSIIPGENIFMSSNDQLLIKNIISTDDCNICMDNFSKLQSSVCDDMSKNNTNVLEIGHIFAIGNYFSKKFCFKKDLYLGSFGIGIERLILAYIEQHIKSDDTFVWQKNISPFSLAIIHERNMPIYNIDENDTIIDDTYDINIGNRIQLYKNIGIPYIMYYDYQNKNCVLINMLDNNNIILDKFDGKYISNI